MGGWEKGELGATADGKPDGIRKVPEEVGNPEPPSFYLKKTLLRLWGLGFRADKDRVVRGCLCERVGGFVSSYYYLSDRHIGQWHLSIYKQQRNHSTNCGPRSLGLPAVDCGKWKRAVDPGSSFPWEWTEGTSNRGYPGKPHEPERQVLSCFSAKGAWPVEQDSNCCCKLHMPIWKIILIVICSYRCG